MPRHIKKGDTVIVTAGNDKGRTGEVLRVLTDADRVVVQGVNMRTKHLKPSQDNPQGGILKARDADPHQQRQPGGGRQAHPRAFRDPRRRIEGPRRGAERQGAPRASWREEVTNPTLGVI